MTAVDVRETARRVIADIRSQLAPFGLREGKYGAFRAGHAPRRGEFAFSGTVFGGLSENEIDELERSLPYPVPEQSCAIIPDAFRDFLSVSNGLRVHALSINGMYWRLGDGVGAPIGLHYPNLERPHGIPRLWFGFGTINGAWYSQGTLYMAETGEVLLVERNAGLIGATWPDFAAFLLQEVARQLASHSPDGDPLPGYEALPQFTQSWEMIAKRFRDERHRQSEARPGDDTEEEGI
jgi:hypothetical protein